MRLILIMSASSACDHAECKRPDPPESGQDLCAPSLPSLEDHTPDQNIYQLQNNYHTLGHYQSFLMFSKIY